MPANTYIDLMVALGLGLLVGLQKERAESPLAGLKTFALVSVAGAVAALVAAETGPWVIVAGLASVTAFMITGNIIQLKLGGANPGQTTEVAVVLMYLTGALTVAGSRPIAVVVGAGLAVLLHMREELKSIVRRLTDRDVRAIMQFVLVSLVVLPAVPNRTFGPYQVLNPHQIWWMVVLIVGLNLAGYAAFRLVGRRRGTALAGVLGGVISSTATTVSYARTTKTDDARVPTASLVIWIASSVVFVRILIEIAAVAPGLLRVAGAPILIMLAVFAAAAQLAWPAGEGPEEPPFDPSNPSELRPAIAFGLLYAGVLFLVAAAEANLGNPGLFIAAAISGLTDVDAITLSTSQLVATGRLDADVAWRVILLASLSNLTFKLGVAATLGGRPLLRRLGRPFGIALGVGAALLVLW